MPEQAPPIILTDWEEKARVVELAAHDLPEPPLQLGGETRRRVTRYVGTGEASAQILGLEYSRIDIKGKFEDQLGGKGHAGRAWAAIESMWRAQHLVRLEYGPHVYWGILDVKGSKAHAAEVGYNLIFEILWDKDPDAERPSRFETPPAPAVEDVALELDQPVAEAEGAPDVVAEFAADVLIGLLEAQSALGAAMATLSGAVSWAELAGDTASETSRYLGRASGALGATVAKLQAATFEAIAGQGGPSEAQAAAWALGLGESTSRARAAVVALWREFEAARKPGGLRVHVASVTDTLQRLAARYYGDWTLWSRIADANALEDTLLTAGQTLIIPER